MSTVLASCLLEHGFQFKFPAWREAAHDLCQQWKVERDGERAAA